MLAEERKRAICEIVNQKKIAKVSELSKALNTTEATVRRDLDELQEKKLLRRTHGGAIAIYSAGIEFSIRDLAIKNMDSKQKIAQKAIDFIDDNDTVMLDGSSTVLELCKLMVKGSFKNIIVLTNAISVLTVLSQNPNITVLLIGGEYKSSIDSTIGGLAEKSIKDLRVDKTFIGINGIDHDYGYSITNFEEATIKKEMLRIAKQKFVLADFTKFGETYLAKVAEFEGDIDYLITDKESDNVDYNQMKECVQLLIADE